MVTVNERPTVLAQAVPELKSAESGSVESWWYDTDGTRYRLLVIALEHGTLLCAGFGEPRGDWWLTERQMGETWEVAWSYVAEKLKLRPGDRPGYTALITDATGWTVR